jgi:hypothetical protein
MIRSVSWLRWMAAPLLIAGLAWFIAYAVQTPNITPPGAPPAYTDTMLYTSISERVARGENYYTAAATEHRAHGYPTAPAWVFREPALTWLSIAVGGPEGLLAAMIALAVTTALAFRSALEREGMPALYRVPAMLIMTGGLWIAAAPHGYFIHDAWAGLIIALSLALYRPERWGLAVFLGLVACLFRELALPYLGAMCIFAILERRWAEAAGWVAGGLTFAAIFAAHLALAGRLHLVGDHVSQGWATFGGIPFVIETARRDIVLNTAPRWLTALSIGLAAIGFAGSRNAVARRAGLVTGGYMAAFLFVGRPDNVYWGLLYAPTLPLGIVLSPLAIVASASNLRTPRGSRRASPILAVVTRSPEDRNSAGVGD